MNCSSVGRISLVQALCESPFLSIQRWHRRLWWYYPCIQTQLKRQMRDRHSFLKPHALNRCALFAGAICCLTSLYSDSSFCAAYMAISLWISHPAPFSAVDLSVIFVLEKPGIVMYSRLESPLFQSFDEYFQFSIWSWIHKRSLKVKDTGHRKLQNQSNS